MAGVTSSNNSGDVGSNHGENDSWVIKLNSNGDIVWSKVLGGNKTDGAYAISGTKDGGCIVGSSTYSSESGDVTGKNHGLSDMWVVKLDASGNVTWNTLIGGSKYENVSADRIVLTSDGGYILAGYSNSSDGDVDANKGNYDNWLVKLNNKGQKMWSKTTGNSWDEWTSDFLLNTTFNSFYLVGSSNSNLNGAPVTNGLFLLFNVN